MIQLAKTEQCTACGACAYACPKQCITMKEDNQGLLHPAIDDTDCNSCNRCQSVCPILSPVEYASPMKAYAAWSTDAEERRTSASGGIAAEVYKAAIDEGRHIAGAKMNEDFSVSMESAKERSAITEFKNSKYVFSSAYGLFPRIKEILDANGKAVVIGLPCQIAALRKIFRDNENLLLMDVVCHGVTPSSYLQQHIKTLEEESGKKAARISFRDPALQTDTFTFSMYDEHGERFYAQRIVDGDKYQFGYHRAISYRENCYHCIFAKDKRISDATLSDYKGLGRMAPCSFNNKKVSSILVNSAKGESFIKNLIESKRIIAEERPVREPINGDPQLRHPSVKNKFRLSFEKEIKANEGDFEKAMSYVMHKFFFTVYYQNHFLFLKRIVTKMKHIIRKIR